ncbi:MAG: YbaB/EbfC family nucleoid-associated protein [Chlamydiae bacterium]|nr:YbaB/EbfC family nucleoid-associated protein [Chlamydiota bacterium]
MGSGFSKMKKQARMMQEQYEKMREEMQKIQVVGTSGNGLVSITLNGEKEIKKLHIKPECIDPNDPEGLQDLIIAAHSDACRKLDQEGNLGKSFPFST